MKLLTNAYDTIDNRLLVSATLMECLLEEEDFDVEYTKMMYDKLVTQAHHISQEAKRLNFDLLDLTTIAVRLKEVLDNYIRILEKVISDVELHCLPFNQYVAARCIAHVDTEIRQLRFTLEDSEYRHIIAA